MLKEVALRHEETRGRDEPGSESDTEADEGALPTGSRPRGKGPPLQWGSFERRRDLVDGVGIAAWAVGDPLIARGRPLDVEVEGGIA